MTEPFCRGKHALVVEDEAMVAMMLEDMLEELECTIAGTAARLDQALEMAASLKIDFAILDLNLNGELTYPVADRLAERGIPFLFSTGYCTSSLPERFRATPSLSKPFEPRALEVGLASVLRAADG